MAAKEENDDVALDTEREQQLADREKRVNDSLRVDATKAMRIAALENPPFESRSPELKLRACNLFLRVYQALSQRDADVTAFVEALTLDEADKLMKFVMRGLASPQYSAGLLKLHALIVDKCGQGCVVRAIVDRNSA